jgi:hypothetical protein
MCAYEFLIGKKGATAVVTHVYRLPRSIESRKNRLKTTGSFSQHCGFHQLQK